MTTTTPTAKQQLVLDVFTTALEGGIGYWSQATSYHWLNGEDEDYEGFYADIIEVDAEQQQHRIDAGVIRKGLRAYALGQGGTEHRIKPPLVVTADNVEDWDFDAEDADIVVQLGLFGEVVYG
jgi:hypothetical protein